MIDEKETQGQKDHTESQGYCRHDVGKGVFLFLSAKEKHEAQEPQSKARWKDNIRGWVRGTCSWMRRSSAVIIMIATLVNLNVAYLQWSTMSEETAANQRSAKAAEDQLTEMKGSSADTSALAYAAKIQAENIAMLAKASEDQARTAKNTFQLTQRAAVYLGLPDGKVADFIPRPFPYEQRIALYFRNYGTITAQNTTIELWPATLVEPSSTVSVHIPAPQKPKASGSDIPPGFSHTIYWDYFDSSLYMLESERNFLQISGRIRYTYDNREHCESFVIAYVGKPISRFVLSTQGKREEPINFCSEADFVFKRKPRRVLPVDAQNKQYKQYK